MCKKSKQLFKQRLEQNRGMTITGEKISYIIEIPINDYLVAAVDKKSNFINTDEIREQIIDLFRVKREYIKGEKIELSRLTDCVYDLKYIKGTLVGEIKKAYFTIC